MVLVAVGLLAAPFVGLGSASEHEGTHDPAVVVGVPDSGINPYHEQFHRPGFTDHPEDVIEGFPEGLDIQKLELSLSEVHNGDKTLAQAISDDGWADLEPETWYWIPETPFVAVYCEPEEDRATAVSEGSQTCILDDGTSHGTGTTSAVLHENPGALIAFKQGGSGVDAFEAAGLPVDVYSVSWGTIAPVPLPLPPPEGAVYVKAAGNDPRSTYVDGWSGHPGIISVSGAHPDSPAGYGDEPTDARDADVVAWYCRDDLASPMQTTGTHESCGTSFSAPTVAGALSKVILEVRTESGYTGTITQDGSIDPQASVTKADLREAMNQTATYAPENDDSLVTGIQNLPLIEQAPYLQWGWGWYDATVTDDTLAYLDDELDVTKPLGAQLYMDINHQVRSALYGW